jgi:phospholipase C
MMFQAAAISLVIAAAARYALAQSSRRDDTRPSLMPLPGPMQSNASRRAEFRLFAPVLLLTGLLASGCGSQIGTSNDPPPQESWPPPQIKNVVLIIQENRTPDNLFHFLTPACPIPANATGLNACTPSPVTSSCYDISPCALSNQSGTVTPVTLTPLRLDDVMDPGHGHLNFEDMCDPDPVTYKCRNDGAWKTTKPNGGAYAYVANPPVTNSDGSSGHLLDPYLTLAKQYGWANFTYQTNQGPSYPAHQFLFSGTSAITAEDDANSTFVSEGYNQQDDDSGCLTAPGPTQNDFLSPVMSPPPKRCDVYDNGSVQECQVPNTALVYPSNPIGTYCAQHQSMADVLDPKSISWKYYAPSAGSIWTAPDAIASICQPAFVHKDRNPNTEGLECTGAEWNQHVDIASRGTDILRDIASCSLPQVSWVIPDGQWSDHPPGDADGPSWVAAVVNAIGNNPTCPQSTPDAGQNFWQDTAIIITWDDWGGWPDNQVPPSASQLPCISTDCQGDYQYGYRVPLLVVSAYTPPGYIDNTPYDFGTILRTIQGIDSIPEGALGFADKRATTDLRDFFSLTAPRSFQTIPAQHGANYFLTQTGRPMDPDDD